MHAQPLSLLLVKKKKPSQAYFQFAHVLFLNLDLHNLDDTK